MMKSIFTTALLVSSLAFAAEPAKTTKKAESKPVPAAATTGTKVDVTGGLKWTGFGLGKSHSGDIKVSGGQIEMKGDELVGGTFDLDMKSLATADSEKLQGHLKSPDFFDVEKHPKGSFKITKVEAIKDPKAGQATHKITGELTIKGKTNVETFDAIVKKDGTKYTAKATLEIADRTKYDIVYNSAKFKSASALGDKLIKDNIKIDLDIATK